MSRWDRLCDWFEGHGERDLVAYIVLALVVVAVGWLIGALISWL